MKSDRLRHTVQREIANNVAAFRSRPFHAAALECHLRKFLHVEEFRAAQVIVSLFDARVDAADIDLRRDRGVFRMLTINVDLARLNPFRRQPKTKLYVVQKSTTRRTVEPEDVYASVDPILDKIAKSGMGSLTENEKKILDRARNRLLKKSD